MPANWEEMSPAQKVEDLRKDVKRLFEVANQLSANIERTWAVMKGNEVKLNEVAKAVEVLEGKLASRQ